MRLFSTVAGAVLALTACRVVFPDDQPYACKTDADCGGGGYTCVAAPVLHCCLMASDGKEICGNGLDDDCDGNADGIGRTEVCNGLDDNCDGNTDEGFSLSADRQNCGTCGHRCVGNELCTNGQCIPLVEDNCQDGFDNDRNGPIDCDDPGCDHQSCGQGCVCKAMAKAEADCNDGLDGDGDQIIDCADDDCLGLPCGEGCACMMGGGKREALCWDQLDNDGDLLIDCDDPDCLAKFCTPGPQVFFTCTAAHACNCNGGQQVAEMGTGFCSDGLDNDCNGKTDCAEVTCNAQPCTFDGGSGTCATLTCQ